jgi:hypothetical protein
MAIKLIANYSKRLGLPGYSSHQFSVSIETEVLNPGDVGNQSERLYQLLQSNVDEQIQSTGFVPPLDYGMDGPNTTTQPPSNGHNGHPGSNGSGPLNGRWKCSDKQKDLILKLVEEHQLDKNGVEALAVERFGKGVRLLNKVEASGLLDELLDTHGSGQRQGNRRNDSAYNGANGRSAA